MSELGKQFDLLLGKYDALAARMRHIDFDTEICGERIEVRGTHLCFRDGDATVDEFIDVIANEIAAFCLPRNEIDKAAQLFRDGNNSQATTEFTRLVLRAQKLFIQAQEGSKRSGEAGEVILYILNEWVLKAPQIVSKMYLKTNNQMPVFGTDGIHARFDETTKKLHLYWGESKAHKTLSGGLSAALTSIKEFVKAGHEQREIEIVASYLDMGTASKQAREAFLDYLNPYAEDSNNRIATFSCLLMFNYKYPDEADFEQRFRKDVSEFIQNVSADIKTAELELKRFEFFLLPVPDVQIMRDKFAKKIGATSA